MTEYIRMECDCCDNMVEERVVYVDEYENGFESGYTIHIGVPHSFKRPLCEKCAKKIKEEEEAKRVFAKNAFIEEERLKQQRKKEADAVEKIIIEMEEICDMIYYEEEEEEILHLGDISVKLEELQNTYRLLHPKTKGAKK